MIRLAFYLHSGLELIRLVIFGSKIGLLAQKQVSDTIPPVRSHMFENIYGQDNKNGTEKGHSLAKFSLAMIIYSGKKSYEEKLILHLR